MGDNLRNWLIGGGVAGGVSSLTGIAKLVLEFYRKRHRAFQLPRKNQYFIGREDTLKMLRKGFSKRSTTVQVIAGLGGVGKSQTVLAYAHRKLSKYPCAVWWINAEVSPLEDCRKLLLRFGFPDDIEHHDENAVLPALQKWYDEHRRWLLIFDNAQEYNKLRPWLPTNKNGQVLITTRDAKAFEHMNPFVLDVFSESTALTFLRGRTKRKTGNHAKSLVNHLGCLPLALEQTASYMAETGKSCEDYLALLERQGLRLLERGQPIDYEHVVTTTWHISTKKLSEAARQLLYMCSFCKPVDIPIRIFFDDTNKLPDPLQSKLADELDRDDVVAELTKYSLLKAGDRGLYSMHRLLRQVIRRDADDEALCYAAILNIIIAALPQKFDTNEAYEQLALLGYHAISVLDDPARAYEKNNINAMNVIVATRHNLAQHLGNMSLRNYRQQHGPKGKGI